MLTVALILASLCQETVDNPEYKGWAAFQPGSSVTFTLTRNGTVQEGVQRITLRAISEKSALLELEILREDLPPMKPMERRVPSRIPAAVAERVVATGDEELEVGGKKLACLWKELEKTMPDGKTVKAKVWTSDEVPGTVVKIEGGGSVMNAQSWAKK